MKKVLLLAVVLGSFNVFAEDQPVAVGQSDASTIDCTKIFGGNADKAAVGTEKPVQPTTSGSKSE